MNRAIIIHGWGGEPNEGWLPWLKVDLENRDWNVQAPQMPNAKEPKLEEWLQTLRELVGKCDNQTYFVGHSLGCYAFLKYIEQLGVGERVGGGVMVAGFAGHLKHKVTVLQEFYKDGLHWDKINEHGGEYVAIYSERDDWVRVESAHEFEKHLAAKLIKNNEWEHFSGSEGIVQLPDALNSLLKIANI